MRWWSSNIKIYLYFLVATLISYAYVIQGDFIGDDIGRIVFSDEVNSFRRALTGALADRPLLMVIVTIINKIFGHTSTIPYRLVGIFLHCLVSLQIYLLLLDLNKDSQNQYKNEDAFLSALLFTLHPLHNQTLTTSIQMGISMAAFFGLLSLRFFIKNWKKTQISSYLFSSFCFFTSLLCKPITIFFPMYYVTQFKYLHAGRKTKIAICLLYFTMLIIPLYYYSILKRNIQGPSFFDLQYLLAQAEVTLKYFQLIVVPYGLKFMYDFPLPDVHSAFHWLLLGTHAALIIVGIKYLRDKILKMLFIGFYMSFIPESSAFYIYHLAFEHRTYLALAFLFMFLGRLLALTQTEKNRRIIIRILFGFVAVIYFGLVQMRNREVKSYRDWATHSMENSDIYHQANYGSIYFLAKKGFIEDSRRFIVKLATKYPQHEYDAMTIIADAYQYGIEDGKYLDSLNSYADRLYVTNWIRYFLNRTIRELYLDNFKTQKNHLMLFKIEKSLSYQMKVFTQNLMMKEFIDTYFTLVKYLHSEPIVEEFKKYDYDNYLKSRAMLVYYFKKKDPNLISEIEQGLKIRPYSTVLKDIHLKLLRVLQN